MELIGEFITSFFSGLKAVTISLFGKYTFSLWDIFFVACVFGIVGFIVWNIIDK